MDAVAGMGGWQVDVAVTCRERAPFTRLSLRCLPRQERPVLHSASRHVPTCLRSCRRVRGNTAHQRRQRSARLRGSSIGRARGWGGSFAFTPWRGPAASSLTFAAPSLPLAGVSVPAAVDANWVTGEASEIFPHQRCELLLANGISTGRDRVEAKISSCFNGQKFQGFATDPQRQ